jgi:tetratricopeptide (TPR) repeat protein
MASSEQPESFSPKSFLKARRPERFSDTTAKEATELDRSLLEFHLNSLTSRGQETDFEHFARRLCEREICPNLLPQTGPTGGGDSKVDSETYPVAEGLTLAWYTGVGREAGQERWAFAFSAKADWASKGRSDIAKIAGTGRGYTKAFFVTNQAVADRKRANFEDTLRAKYGIDVRVLDRTWILDRVFTNHHEGLAVSELKATGLSRREVVKGPRDVKRQGELDEVEKRIHEGVEAGRFGGALVDDALDAADLARGLESPRNQVEGRYARADELAGKYGSSRQQVEVAYQWAWTLYYWFEDYGAFAEQYGIVEARARGSQNAYDLERVFTLWITLHWTVGRGDLDPEKASYEARTETLITELNRLKSEKDRPSAVLQAETMLLEVQLARRLYAKEPFDDVLRSLKQVVLRSEGLVGYPLEPLVESLSEIGPVLEGSPAYGELFETIVQVASTRDGEIRGARLLLARGETQLLQGRRVEAIATLGRSVVHLYRHESRRDITKALYLCGCAYDEIGLPWAARGTLLAAASVATNDFWQYGEITPYQAACYRQLKWVELRLGRLPHILAWHELDVIVRHELATRGYDPQMLFDTEVPFEALLARLFLRTDFFDLKSLEGLPDVLDHLGLHIAADALLYVLGHKERFEEAARGLGDNPDVLASKCWNLKADVPLPEHPLLYNQQTVLLQSRVLGCQIRVECKTDPPCVEVGESILAALESFLATSALDRAIAFEPELTMEVRTSDFVEFPMSVSVEERAGRPHVVVRCHAFDPQAVPLDKQGKVQEAIFDVTVTTFAQFVKFKDSKRDLEALFRDERVWERAVAFASRLETQANVLGPSPRTRLASWIDQHASVYPLIRTEPWAPKQVEIAAEEKGDFVLARPAQDGKLPPELSPPSLRSHEEIETASLIRGRLWERAGWTGIAFLTDLANEGPPIFALIFSNREAGREIFVHWRKELGKVDAQKRMRLAIVRGIDKTHPHAYRVVIGSVPSVSPTRTRFVTLVSRIHRMDATTSENLDRFLNAYGAIHAFYLAPAFAPHGLEGGQGAEVETDLAIGMRDIHVRNAWEIGPRDIDSSSIQEDDDPIIPEGVKDAPVVQLIRTMRSEREKDPGPPAEGDPPQ